MSSFPMSSRRSEFMQGFKQAAPVLLGVTPFGLIAGVSAVGVGLPKLEAVLMSAIVFAGASQLAGLQLIGAGAPVAVILVTTLVINLRLVMYSASIAPHFRRLPALWKGLLAYLMTDQAYAFAISRFVREPGMPHKRWYYLGAAAPIWLVWMAATTVGVLLSGQLPESWSLEFAIPLTFMALLVPAMKDRPSVVAAAVGGGAATLGAGLPFNLGLIVAALLGIAAGVLSEGRDGGRV